MGLPALPALSNESIYLADSDAVPLEWRNAMEYMLRSRDQTIKPRDAEKPSDSTITRFCLATRLKWESLHMLIYLVRTRKTTLCYDTHGFIDKEDESTKHTKLRTRKAWSIETSYRKLLQKIAACAGDTIEKLQGTDILIRCKRSERDPSATTTTKDGRSFCYLGFTTEEGQPQLAWIETTPSFELHHLSPKPMIINPASCCHKEGCTINTSLLQCARCQNVFYCSRQHQKEEWVEHKLVCKPL